MHAVCGDVYAEDSDADMNGVSAYSVADHGELQLACSSTLAATRSSSASFLAHYLRSLIEQPPPASGLVLILFSIP